MHSQQGQNLARTRLFAVASLFVSSSPSAHGHSSPGSSPGYIMTVQNFGLAFLVFTLVIASTYSSPISPVRYHEEGATTRDGDEVWGRVFNLETPAQREDRVLEADKDEPKSPADDIAAMSYVDASVFRQTAPTPKPDKLKPKGSVFAKKAFPSYNKYAKEQNELKHRLEAQEEEKKSSSEESNTDETIDETTASILGAIQVDIDGSDQENAETSVSTTILSTTVAATTIASTTTAEGKTEVSTTATESTTRSNEDSVLPRLSPPIWLHSSAAEMLSDPLRLPMIETFDRDDRYAHSIARDVFW